MEVHLDGEPVVFEGPIPATVDLLVALLAGAVEPHGRELGDLRLDGRTVEFEDFKRSPEAFQRIEATSIEKEVEVDPAVFAAALSQEIAALIEATGQLARRTLREPKAALASARRAWLTACDSVLNGTAVLQRLAREAVPTLRPPLVRFVEAQEETTVANLQGDTARLALLLEDTIVPALRELRSAVEAVAGGAR